jgi:hypothetical protein
VMTMAVTRMAIRNRLKKLCCGCSGSFSESMSLVRLFALGFRGQTDL